MSKLTKAQLDILGAVAEQPGGGIPVNELPLSMSYHDYRECRDLDLIIEKPGRGGFVVAWITKSGRLALSKEGEAS